MGNVGKTTLVCASLLVPTAAFGFNHCKVTQIGDSASQMAEEGSNPVIFGSNVYVGYTDGSNVAIFRAPNGRLKTPATFPGAGVTHDLRLGASHQHVYAAWHTEAHRSTSQMFAVSNDYGVTWSAPVTVGPANGAINSQMAVDDRNVHLIYGLPDKTVVVVSSTDGGNSFAAPVALGSGREVVVASSGMSVYAAWEDLSKGHDVMVAASQDGGKTFTVNDASGPGVSAREPIFSLDGGSGRLSLVWRTDNPMDAIYMQSSDGISWSSPIVIDTLSRQVMVSDAGNGDIYVTYLRQNMHKGITDWQVYLSTSKDGGQTFSPGQRISGPTGIKKIVGDTLRPMPWASGRDFTIAAMKADGAYVWSGQNRTITGHPKYLGPGTYASPAGNGVGWLGSDGVMYARCRYTQR